MSGAPARPLRLWLMSDLRVDREPYDLPSPLPDFDALVVAGGISDCLERSVRWLASRLDGRLRGRPALLVPGNAEFWDGGTMPENLARAKAVAERTGIAVLSDAVIRLPNGPRPSVHVVGATLWVDWALNGRRRAAGGRSMARHYAVDCRRIRLGGRRYQMPHDAAGAHARSRAFIEDVLASVAVQGGGNGPSPVALVHGVRRGDRAVVVTHHAPSRLSLPDALGPGLCDEWVPASMASDLGEVMDAFGAPALWLHGHVPEPVRYRLHRTTVVANPRPPPGLRNAFDPALVLEV